MGHSRLATYINHSPSWVECEVPRSSVLILPFVGKLRTAREGVDYFMNPDRHEAVNYFIGYEGSIGVSVEEELCPLSPSQYDEFLGKRNILVGVSVGKDLKMTAASYKAFILLTAEIAVRNSLDYLGMNCGVNAYDVFIDNIPAILNSLCEYSILTGTAEDNHTRVECLRNWSKLAIIDSGFAGEAVKKGVLTVGDAFRIFEGDENNA